MAIAEVKENGVVGQEVLKQRLKAQAEEAIGPVNVYFYKLNNPWVLCPSPDQLMAWYIKNGGAVGYRAREIEYRNRLEQESQQREATTSVVVAQG